MNQTEKAPSGELAGIGDLLGNTWQIYRARWLTLIAVWLAAILLPLVSFAIPFGIGFFAWQSMPHLKMVIMLASLLLALAASIWVGNWGMSAFFTAVANEECGVKQAFEQAKPLVLAHLWLSLVTGIILTGAYLLIIPGIIFTVWFFFAPFVLITENVRGMNALLKSKVYVQGQWVPVCVRLLAIWLVSVVVSCVPILGQLLALLFIPFNFIYTFLVYQNLKTNKGSLSFEPSKKAKATVLATGTLGYVTPVLIIFVFLGSMALMPFAMLKAAVTGDSPLPVAMQGFQSQGAAKGQASFSVLPAAPATSTSTQKDLQTFGDQSQDWMNRSQAALRLGQAKDQKAIVPLIQAVKNEEQWVVRQNAIKSLSNLGARRAVPTIIQALESDKNIFVRASAAEALGKLGDHRAVGALKKALNDQETLTSFKEDGTSEEVKKVALAAQEALKRLHAHGGTPLPPEATASPVGEPTQDKETASQANLAQVDQKTIDACTKALKIQPGDALSYHNRAVAYYRVGKYQEAISDFTKAIELDPKNASAYYNRAIVYGTVGKHEEAISDGVKAIELNPKDAKAHMNRGIDYLSIGEWNKAVDDFNQAVGLDTNDGSAYYARAFAYYKLGSQEEALKNFQKASQLGNKKAKEYLKAQAAGPQS